MHTTFRPKHMILFLLYFFFQCPQRWVPFIFTRPFDRNILSFIIYSFFRARPFDQELRSPLIYFFYLHTTTRQKYKVLFYLFCILHTTIRLKLGPWLIYLCYLHTTIRPNYMVLFHLFFLLCKTIQPRVRVLTDLLLLFPYDHSTKIYGPLLRILYFIHGHSTKS